MAHFLQDRLKASINWPLPMLGCICLWLTACQTPAPEPVWEVPYRCGGNLEVRLDGSRLLTNCLHQYTLYDLNNGDVLWQEDHETPIQLLPSSDALRVGFGLDGEHVWWIEGEIGEHARQQVTYASVSSGLQHCLPPAKGLFLFQPSVVDAQAFLADESGLGLYDLAGDSLVWWQSSYWRTPPALLWEAAPNLAYWLVHQGKVLILDPMTGEVLRESRLTALPQGYPPAGFVGGSFGSAFLGVDSTVTALLMETGQVSWTFTTPKAIDRLLVLPDNYLLVCTEDEQLFRLNGYTGEVVSHCTRYQCSSPFPALPAVHPQDGRIALNVYCDEKTGVAVLDPTTLEELNFVPQASVHTLGPLFWEDLIVHFPSAPRCIRAVRLPATQ